MGVTALTNTTATNALAQQKIHGSNAALETQKLASGSRLVTASQDSAAAAIASQLQSTVNVLKQANVNTNNAIGVVQVATASMKNISSLITTMDALATQANSGDLDATSRSMVEKQYGQLLQQIDDIANRTRWNGVALLDGGNGAVSMNAAAVAQAGTGVVQSASAGNGFAAGLTAGNGYISGMAESVSVTQNGAGFDVSVVIGGQTFEHKGFVAATGKAMQLTSTSDSNNFVTFTTDAAIANLDTAARFKTELESTLGLNAGAATASFVSANADASAAQNGLTLNAAGVVGVGSNTPAGEYAFSYAANSGKLHLSSNAGSWEATAVAGERVTFGNGLSVALPSGWSNATGYNQSIIKIDGGSQRSLEFQTAELSTDTLKVDFGGATAAALGLSGTSVDTPENARSASNAIKDALTAINQSYATLGAQQQRLEYTSANIATQIENLDAARANYNDTDVAESITKYTIGNSMTQFADMALGKALARNQQLVGLAQQTA